LRVGVCILATGKYNRFVPALVASLRQFFLKSHNVSILVFTDNTERIEGATVCTALHMRWPDSTLYRYHQLLKHVEALRGFEYLWHIDADMKAVEPMDDEILGDTVACMSPACIDWEQESRPFERRPYSTAYVAHGTKAEYVAGALVGGKTDAFIAMAQTIAHNIDVDDSHQILARCNEESHLNRWFVDHPPALLLTPEYCCPEKATLRPRYQRRIMLNVDKPDLEAVKK